MKHIAIKICTPTQSMHQWGDTAYALSLAGALHEFGYCCEVLCRDKWEKSAPVVINISGLQNIPPQKNAFNFLWLISHPEKHPPSAVAAYDCLLVASETYAAKLNIPQKVYFLPQASDEELFHPQTASDYFCDVLFVGNNYYDHFKYRKVIDFLRQAKFSNFKVVGENWQDVLPQANILSRFVDYKALPALYAQAKINLNDHHETMRQQGFINNRTYDLARSGAFQLCDEVEGVKKLGIETYADAQELVTKISYYLTNETERQRRIKIARLLTQNATFRERAKFIDKIIGESNVF